MRTEAILLIRCNCFEMWWPGTELNRRRQPFQGCALPPELPGHVSRPAHPPRATRIVRFTPIVEGMPTGKQLKAECVRNVVDYSKALLRSTPTKRLTILYESNGKHSTHIKSSTAL